MKKEELRKISKEITKKLSEDYKNIASAEISRILTDSEIFLNSDSVLIYLSTATEPDTSDIVSKALCSGKKVFVSVCINDCEMKISEIDCNTQYDKNKYGIKEPKTKYFSAIIPDLIIMPCVASGKDRTRLGHGKGYYDRYLQNIHTNTVCLCFSKLLFDSLPQDKYDIKPDMIITETGTIK